MSEIFMLRAKEENFFQELYLNFCGYEECEPLHSWGTGVRPTYVIHYVLSGEGRYHAKDRSWNLHAGDGFLIEPETPVFYQADVRDPWCYIWIGFSGEHAGELLHRMGLGDDKLTFHCERREELEGVVRNMLRHSSYSEENDLIIQSDLYRFFAILMKEMRTTEKSRSDNRNRYIQIAIQYIRNHYTSPIRVENIADYVGVHRSYLCSLFKQETGMSPQQYLANFRLSMASEMLAVTAYPIESVALSCGYQDPLVFSKAFKRKYQITPKGYRTRASLNSEQTLRRQKGMEALQAEEGKEDG